MPKFSLSWEKIYYNEWSNPPEIKTASGMLIVEAPSLSAVEEEVKRHKGKECSLDERVDISGITEYIGLEKALPLSKIGELMDPWATVAKAS